MGGTEKQVVGRRGEQAAVLFLQQKGYEVVQTNYLVRGGEIDIIAWDTHGVQRVLCFIEVKTRKYEDGSAERATNYIKLKRIFWAARVFCIKEKVNMETTPIRFEHVSVYLWVTHTWKIFHYVIPID